VALALALVAVVAALTPSIVLLVNPDLTDPLGELSYAGVFLVNLISTATLFFPVPGVTATANVLIVTEASDSRFPWLVGVAGGSGMAVGEFTAYYTGFFGSEIAQRQRIPFPARIEPFVQRVTDFVSRMMGRWGTLTLFVLAAIPDPVFEVAAMTAGSTRMPLRRFVAAVFAGCVVRGLTLAYLGTRLPFLA
jgi:membrane protein DedA with SNARE-associated domain